MYEHRFIRTNGITLHTIMAGPEDGPVVLLLHGFPEFWYGWRGQIPALAAAGYRVWAPDQRGYNLSDKPRGADAYRSEALVRDVLGLIDATGRERVFLAGHDWGAFVGWWVASVAPERLHHLAILNAPHPRVAFRHLSSDPRQMIRSTYAAFFRIPWLPERLLRAGDWRPMAGMLKQSSLPGTFSDAELAEYRQAWSQPRAISAMLNWYRAAARWPHDSIPPNERVSVPTTIIWGKRDVALRSVMAEESAQLCNRGELVWFPENTHWMQHEAADRVNTLLLARFAEYA